ncbi:MAG TPA: PorV/PorQ family protein [Ignavibacteriales bacterium]|nr:PorV/PorQ family protein [Ignavibacteriales bacterium]
MKRYTKHICLMLLLLLATAEIIHAGGGKRNGTGGASELLIPVGVRGIGLSGANTSTTTGIEALYWNPAGIAKTDKTAEATFSYMKYIADMGVTYGAVEANISGFGALAFSIKSLSFGDINVTTTQNPDGTGESFSPQFLTIGLSYARALSDRVSVGITGNMIMETIAQVSSTGFAFNVGIMYENLGDLTGLSLGVAIKNLGPQMTFSGPGLYTQATASSFERPAQLYKIEAAGFELPSQLEFGLAYRPVLDAQNSLLVATTFQNNNFSGDVYKAGAEYTFNNLLSIRGGYAYTPKSQETGNIWGFTAGAGLNYDIGGGTDIRVDYAYRQVKSSFDANHVFSVGLAF